MPEQELKSPPTPLKPSPTACVKGEEEEEEEEEEELWRYWQTTSLESAEEEEGTNRVDDKVDRPHGLTSGGVPHNWCRFTFDIVQAVAVLLLPFFFNASKKTKK